MEALLKNIIIKQGGKADFSGLAEAFMNQYVIRVNECEYEPVEIEFYYYKKDVHEDVFTHPHQLPAGRWRAHPSGIDLTIGYGNEDEGYGGILIRSVRKKEEGHQRFINGPLRVLGDFIAQFKGAFSAEQNEMRLVKRDEHLEEKPISGSRIGLNKTKHKDFAMESYRFVTQLKGNRIAQKEMLLEEAQLDPCKVIEILDYKPAWLKKECQQEKRQENKQPV